MTLLKPRAANKPPVDDIDAMLDAIPPEEDLDALLDATPPASEEDERAWRRERKRLPREGSPLIEADDGGTMIEPSRVSGTPENLAIDPSAYEIPEPVRRGIDWIARQSIPGRVYGAGSEALEGDAAGVASALLGFGEVGADDDDATLIAPEEVSPRAVHGGLGQGVTFGFEDEIVGLADEEAGEQLREHREAQRAAYPASYGGGQLAGQAPFALIPGAGTIPGLGTAGRIAATGIEGAGMSAIQAAGEARPGERGEAALRGAVVGAPLGVAAGVLPELGALGNRDVAVGQRGRSMGLGYQQQANRAERAGAVIVRRAQAEPVQDLTAEVTPLFDEGLDEIPTSVPPPRPPRALPPPDEGGFVPDAPTVTAQPSAITPADEIEFSAAEREAVRVEAGGPPREEFRRRVAGRRVLADLNAADAREAEWNTGATGSFDVDVLRAGAPEVGRTQAGGFDPLQASPARVARAAMDAPAPRATGDFETRGVVNDMDLARMQASRLRAGQPALEAEQLRPEVYARTGALPAQPPPVPREAPRTFEMDRPEDMTAYARSADELPPLPSRREAVAAPSLRQPLDADRLPSAYREAAATPPPARPASPPPLPPRPPREEALFDVDLPETAPTPRRPRAQPLDAREAFQRRARELGITARSPAAAREQAQAMREVGGADMERVTQAMASPGAPRVDLRDIAADLRARAARLAEVPMGEAQGAALSSMADTFEARGAVTFANAHQARQILDDGARWARDPASDPGIEARRAARAMLDRAMTDAVEAFDPALAQAWRSGNERWMVGDIVATAADQTVERAARLDYPLRSAPAQAAGVQAALSGNPAGAVAVIGAPAAFRAARTYMPAARAAMHESLLRMARSEPWRLGRWGDMLRRAARQGPAAFAAALTMAREEDPDLARRIDAAEQQEMQP